MFNNYLKECNKKAQPIKTPLGILQGRDCIFMDTVTFDDFGDLVFKGDINGELVSEHKNEKELFPYILTFKRVLIHFACELDSYENLVGLSNLYYGSSFDVINDSNWLKEFPIRRDFDKGIYKHYRVFTYDVVYDIIAVDFKIDIILG